MSKSEPDVITADEFNGLEDSRMASNRQIVSSLKNLEAGVVVICVTELQRPTDSFDVQLARCEPRLN